MAIGLSCAAGMAGTAAQLVPGHLCPVFTVPAFCTEECHQFMSICPHLALCVNEHMQSIHSLPIKRRKLKKCCYEVAAVHMSFHPKHRFLYSDSVFQTSASLQDKIHIKTIFCSETPCAHRYKKPLLLFHLHKAGDVENKALTTMAQTLAAFGFSGS